MTSSVDVVLQDTTTLKIRFVSIDQIKSHFETDNPTEEQIDDWIERKCREICNPPEHRVDTWIVPDEFDPLFCPQCESKSVVLNHLSII